jgi:hypothetical protein
VMSCAVVPAPNKQRRRGIPAYAIGP